MLNRELEQTLNEAFQNARVKRHEFMTVEHLLLALIDNTEANIVLNACGANLVLLRKELSDFVEATTPIIPQGDELRETQPTLGFQRVLQRAVFHVQSSGKAEVTGANVLVAIYSEQESQAVYFLKQQSIARLDVVNYISHGISKVSEQEDDPSQTFGEIFEEDQPQQDSKSALENYAVNLNRAASEGKIDPLIGRDEEVSRLVQTLARRRKSNPLLVGDSGVGKTAIVEGLAKRIIDGDVPEIISNAVVYSLDMGALLAGTKYRGDFEKRFKALLAELKKQPHGILFMGEIRCIGSTTFTEYRGIFEKDGALTRRFQKIDVGQPSVEDTYQILKGLKSRFEEHHALTYTDNALRAAAELSERYITDRNLPDKAIDVIDEVGAFQQLQPESKRKSLIDVADVEHIIASIARIPAKTVSASDKELLYKLEDKLSMVVFGQDEAIQTLATAVKMSRAGLSSPEKPIGSFLFAGPTGVGKTEVARQLSMVMGMELVRFDMSEYMERHTVSRLIGAPPGYVGYDQGGLLTEAVNKTPHCVLLLDEIEKAHPEVFNILLQVMDHGTLTDNNGRKTDFRNVILIMTTNAGAEALGRTSIGFARTTSSGDEMGEIKRIFTPEFRNRLDAIISFDMLSHEVIMRVVDKFLMELEEQLHERKVDATFTPELRAYLAEKGFDPKMGARPMQRLIQDSIRRVLADELLFGRLVNGGEVEVDLDAQGEITLIFDGSDGDASASDAKAPSAPEPELVD